MSVCLRAWIEVDRAVRWYELLSSLNFNDIFKSSKIIKLVYLHEKIKASTFGFLEDHANSIRREVIIVYFFIYNVSLMTPYT